MVPFLVCNVSKSEVSVNVGWVLSDNVLVDVASFDKVVLRLKPEAVVKVSSDSQSYYSGALITLKGLILKKMIANLDCFLINFMSFFDLACFKAKSS